jgi:hypothetical protein
MTRQTTQAGPGSEFFTRTRFIQPPVAKGSLVAWYPFRSGTGEDITAGDSDFGDTTDYSAVVNGATFKPSGGVTDIETGANSGAFDLDGVDDTLDLGTVADSNQSFTVMSWVRPDSVNTTTRQRVVTKSDGSSFPDGTVILQLLSDGTTRFTVVNNGNFNRATSPSPLSANSFAHLAGRYNFQSKSVSLLINGQPVATGSAGQMPALSSQPWRVGEDTPIGGASEFFDGTVDGTRIYTAPLSDSQINQIYLNTEP